MRWPWSRRREAPAAEPPAAPAPRAWTLDDPTQVPSWIPGYAGPDDEGAYVTAGQALGVSAFYRGVSLISGTIATLPLRSYTGQRGGGQARPVGSIFDAPAGPDGQTQFEWLETCLLHILLHGNIYLRHRYNGGGGFYALEPIHPLHVDVQPAAPWGETQANGTRIPPRGGKWFVINYPDGPYRAVHREVVDANDLTHIPAASMDGLKGMSLLTVARRSLSTALDGDRAAKKLFRTGAMISGMVTPEDDLEPDEADEAKRQIINATSGWENAGGIAVLNRSLKYTPWTMSAADAQFLQSRQFSIEEIARWTGVPPHLLMQTEKQTSWGTGVAEQNDALSRHTLNPWTSRIEQRLSRLLAQPRWVEFDYAGLKRPTFAEEVRLLLEQTGGKPLLTQDEARAIRNLPPVGGDAAVLNPAPAPAPAADPADVVDEEVPA